MKFADIAIIAGVAILVVLVIRYLRKKKTHCSCGCGSCPYSSECSRKKTDLR